MGCSIVTLQHLHAHLQFLHDLFVSSSHKTVHITEEVVHLYRSTADSLSSVNSRKATTSDSHRQTIMEALGTAGTTYRTKLYTKGFSGHTIEVELQELAQFLDLARKAIVPTLAEARMDNGMCHAFNWLKPNEDGLLQIKPNLLMLEGQVAALESNLLTARQRWTFFKNFATATCGPRDSRAFCSTLTNAHSVLYILIV